MNAPTHSKLTPEQVDAFGAEIEALRARVVDSLGEDDARYIRSIRTAVRATEASGRALLVAGWLPPAWLAGTALLGLSKILDNMELGHNVMHGQFDWMNDPEFRSQTYEWDAYTPGDGWRHSHNYVHHMFTNVVGKDRDVGYGILRMCPEQRWHPGYLPQPLYAAALAVNFQAAVAVHDLELDRLASGERPLSDVGPGARAVSQKMGRLMAKDYVLFPLLAGPAFLPVVTGNATANLIRNLWAFSVIFCGHFTDDAEMFSEDVLESETRGQWYLRQIAGSSNLEGGRLFHILTGNLSHQIEHHLFPDVPANRYAEMAKEVREITGRYGVKYNTGSLRRQFASVWKRIVVNALPTRSRRAASTPPSAERAVDTDALAA